jgi:hypothetical protein
MAYFANVRVSRNSLQPENSGAFDPIADSLSMGMIPY